MISKELLLLGKKSHLTALELLNHGCRVKHVWIREAKPRK